MILNEIEGGRLKMGEAVEMMVVSLRQARRLRAAYRQDGVEGLAHGNRGRRPHNALDADVAATVV